MAITPIIDDTELTLVQSLYQETAPRYARQPIVGLPGTLHTQLGRASHRVVIEGVLLGEAGATSLATLQEKAASGAEVTFAADITTALTLDKMVIESFAAHQVVGRVDQYAYRIALAESPELPPPAEVEPFGGLGEFGMGDLGFDPGALGDVMGAIAEQAGAIASAVDAAMDAVKQLEALASLADFATDNPIQPLLSKVGEAGAIAPALQGVADLLGGLL